MSAPDRACPDYPGECIHPWAHARTHAEVKATQMPSADAVMHDAIEHALWQDLADALTRLSDYGLDPIAGTVIDAGNAIHGGGVRPPGGYLLRLSGDGLWVVRERTSPADTGETPATAGQALATRIDDDQAGQKTP